MKVRVLAIFAALAPMVFCGVARAEDCGPLHLAIQLQLDMNSGVPILPVSVNGTPRKFLFDTGGVVQQISPAVVKELSLRTLQSGIKIFDVAGNISSRLAYVDSFGIGSVTAKNLEFQISTSALGQHFDGILTPAALPRLDVDIDFGPGRFAYFLQDHCPGRVLYWKATAVAIVPITIQDEHLNVPVTVDGQRFRAIIDTGASETLMDMAVARHVFGLTADSPGMTMERHANGDPNLPIYSYTFSNLSFEGVTIANPHIGLMPDRVASKDPNNNFETGSRIKRVDDETITLPEVIIGMNVLKKMHMYIAYRERNLYITAAGAPDASSPFGAPAK
jgi:predicted aspartyl protease